MSRFYDVFAEVDGHRCKGTWTLRQGGMICVASPWGAEMVECGRLRPEECAVRTLQRIVRAHKKRQNEDLKRQEREVARVNRYWAKKKPAGDHA